MGVPGGVGERDPDVQAFVDETEPEYDWLVPGLLERRDRVIVTGAEGGGKSTLARQMSVQLAAGIHPFTLEEIEPARVLLVDCENSRRHVRRQLRPLLISATQAGRELERDMLFPIVRPEGVNLLSNHDADQLVKHVELDEPALLVIGPSYKLAEGDPTAEETARRVVSVLDTIRERFSCAVLLEAHQPHEQNGQRPRRPYGASLWLRWPEFGLGLSPDGALRMWRGPREERDWPRLLQRGGAWPWTPATERDDGDAGREVERVLRDHLRSGGARSTRACRQAVRDADMRVRNDLIDEVRRELFAEEEW